MSGPVFALGGGAARGLAHIGVLRAFAEAGIQPAAVVGTSMGALVGAFAAAGALERLEAWVRELDPLAVLALLDPSPGGGGLVAGTRLMEALTRLLPDGPVEAFPRPFAAVATELATGRAVVVDSGPWTEAVRASIALPGLLAPVVREGVHLVDGGLAEPVPVGPARDLAGDPVVAVHVGFGLLPLRFGAAEGEEDRIPPPPDAEVDPFRALALELSLSFEELRRRWLERLFPRTGAGPGYLDVVYGSILVLQERLVRAKLAAEPPQLLVAPDVARFGLFAFHRAGEIVEAGYRAGRRALAGVGEVLAGA